ncbi:MAG: hypothetical protein O2954_10080, partial [bacterium]|nr:hypothetical protein [bacterium]
SFLERSKKEGKEDRSLNAARGLILFGENPGSRRLGISEAYTRASEILAESYRVLQRFIAEVARLVKAVEMLINLLSIVDRCDSGR